MGIFSSVHNPFTNFMYLVMRRKAAWPKKATQCSTLTMTFSLTHLAIRLLPRRIMAGPATNQTVKNSVNW